MILIEWTELFRNEIHENRVIRIKIFFFLVVNVQMVHSNTVIFYWIYSFFSSIETDCRLSDRCRQIIKRICGKKCCPTLISVQNFGWRKCIRPNRIVCLMKISRKCFWKFQVIGNFTRNSCFWLRKISILILVKFLVWQQRIPLWKWN